jgi:glycosyltransferase involved in cell wall biosynthesis
MTQAVHDANRSTLQTMRICLVSQEYPPETAWGGVGTQTWVKARALARLGHEVHVLSRSADERSGIRTELQEGVLVHRMQPPGVEFPIYGKPAYMIGYTWHVLAGLHKLMEQYSFDVLDFPEFAGEGFAYQIDRTVWNWAPVVVQLHGPLAMFCEFFQWPEEDSRLKQLGMFFEEFSLKNADVITACSASVAELAGRYYRIPREAIEVVHGGVDTDTFCPRPEVPLEDRPTVLFVGTIVDNKGAHVLAEAVLGLRHKYPDICLKLLGNGRGDELDRIKEKCRVLDAERNVEFAGFVSLDKLPDYYRRAHVFCLPAKYETFANVYIEAMACGCPVIASTSGGGAEAVLDGRTGLLVPPNDVRATAEAIDRVLGDPALRQRMSQEGLQRVTDYFAMDKYIRRVVAAYEKAIEFSRGLGETGKEQLDWKSTLHSRRWKT